MNAEQFVRTMSEFDQLISDCATQGRALARALAADGLTQPLYLYYRPSEPGKGPGRLMLARRDAPVPIGVEVATHEPLRTDVPYANYAQWIRDRALGLPILSH